MSVNKNKYTNKILEKYIATIVLHSAGDTIGFKNGEWEFNYFMDVTEDASLELLYEFIHLGGINGINLDKWYVSDDTYYHIAVGDALISTTPNTEQFYKKIKEKLYLASKEMMHLLEEKNINRYAGFTTIDYITLFKNIDGKDGRTMPYDALSGGSGCAMRSLCIGLALFGEENRFKLIETSIQASKLTHNSPIGYLGGLVTALFTAYALENININKWPFLLMEILQNNQVKSYLTILDEITDYELFLKYWRRYIDTRFKNKEPLKTKANTNILFRTHYYHANFTPDVETIKGEIISNFAGATGYSAPIIAYDCLIDAENNWEKLVIYSMLHIGDSDTTGCIAAGWYGAMYGFGDVPENNLKYLELKEKSYKLGEQLYKKYYLNENILS
jgi:ADP-ribosylarginine hydrolase